MIDSDNGPGVDVDHAAGDVVAYCSPDDELLENIGTQIIHRYRS